MIIKKLTINFHCVRHGWLPFNICANDKPIINISASGVYNPFPEYVDVLKILKYNKKKRIEFFIDQEGFEAKITFINRGRYLFIQTETLRDDQSRCLPLYSGYFDKKQVIKELSSKLLKFYSKNKVEMNNDCYNLGFSSWKLRGVL